MKQDFLTGVGDTMMKGADQLRGMMGKGGAEQPKPLGQPAAGMQYARMEAPQRNDLLQAMLARSRGGRPGGAPTQPLPTPNSQVPTSY